MLPLQKDVRDGHLCYNQMIEIAYRFKVAVYDAYFLALSTTEKRPFVTADYKFAERTKDLKNIIKLSEI